MVKRLGVRMFNAQTVVIDLQKEFESVSIANVKGISVIKCNIKVIYTYVNNVVQLEDGLHLQTAREICPRTRGRDLCRTLSQTLVGISMNAFRITTGQFFSKKAQIRNAFQISRLNM